MWALRLSAVWISGLAMFLEVEQAENSITIKSAFEKMEYISGGCRAKVLE